MVVQQSLIHTQYRMARYYLNKLHVAEAAYHCGHEHSVYALKLLDQDWANIKQWRDWAALHANNNDEIAKLCSEYPQAGSRIFALRQHPQERREWLEDGLSAARRTGNKRAEMIHLALLATTYNQSGPYSRAQEFAEEALVLARHLGDQLYTSIVLQSIGTSFYSQAQYERARIPNIEALALAQDMDAKREIAMALCNLGNVEMGRGHYTQAHDYYLQYLEISETLGDPGNICLALRNLSNVMSYMGNEQSAAQYAERCVVLSRAVGDQIQLSASLNILGRLTADQGNLAEAREYFQQALAASRRSGNRSQETNTLSLLGHLSYELHDFQIALEYLDKAVSLSNNIGDRWQYALANLMLIWVYRKLGNSEQVIERLCEGLETVTAIESGFFRAWYLIEAAKSWDERGQSEQAASWIGLLQEKIKELDTKQKEAIEDIQRNLEAKLGQDRFASATEYGKTLDLGSVLQEILTELRKSPALAEA